MKIKQSVDDWLNQVDYKLMEKEYVPTPFSLTFMNFIKLVNGAEGESTRLLHVVLVPVHPDPKRTGRRMRRPLCGPVLSLQQHAAGHHLPAEDQRLLSSVLYSRTGGICCA